MPGMLTPRCGSLARIGAPVSECSPSTTQELLPDPVAAGRGTPAGRRSRRRARPARRATAGASAAQAGRWGSAGPPASWLEDPVDHGALGDDRLVRVVVVAGVEVLGALRPDRRDRQGPADLVVHVAAQVPRHGLEPGEGVDRGPRLRPVAEAAGVEDRVLDRDVGGVPVLEVGVDALGVLLQRGPGLRLDQRELLARRPGASPWCGRTGRSPGPARRTAPPAGRPSRAAGRPSRRSAPGRARTPGPASGRRSCRRRSAGCRARRGPPSPPRRGRRAGSRRRPAGTAGAPASRR